MSVLCVPVNGVCSQCGEPCAANVKRTCAKGPNGRLVKQPYQQMALTASFNRPKCPHLGNLIGENVKAINCGCGAMTALFECEKFWKDCAPYVNSPRGAVAKNAAGEDVLLCRDCEHNPANATPATTPAATPPTSPPPK